MEAIFNPEIITALLVLTSLEIVLGIDNVIFIAILVSKLEKNLQQKARVTGLALAMIFRIILLLSISWIMQLTKPLFKVMQTEFSGKSLVLLAGGLFLLWKATLEIHREIDHSHGNSEAIVRQSKFWAVISQVVMIDLVFSLDSVITAIGIAEQVWVMICAIIISVLIMMFFANNISKVIEKFPTLKILALAFLILVGVLLVTDAFGKHIERGYIYFAMAFSVIVELVNIKIRGTSDKN